MDENLKVSEECVRLNSNLPNIHFALKSFILNPKAIWTLQNSLYDDFGFESMINSPNFNILSNSTFIKLSDFHLCYVSYRKNNLYASDGIFIQFDENWIEIVHKNLIPAIESMEYDFEQNNVKFKSYKVDFDRNLRPSNEEIIQRVKQIYELLYKYKIISKYDPV